MVYHRLHKGEGRLIIDIKEYEEENDKIQKDNGKKQSAKSGQTIYEANEGKMKTIALCSQVVHHQKK